MKDKSSLFPGGLPLPSVRPPMPPVKPPRDSLDKTDILKNAINTYGVSPQIDMCIEEMSELTKALLKLRRLPVDKLETVAHERLRDDVLFEIADVQIMLDQMKIIFNCDCENEQRYKLQRLRSILSDIERIETE